MGFRDLSDLYHPLGNSVRNCSGSECYQFGFTKGVEGQRLYLYFTSSRDCVHHRSQWKSRYGKYGSRYKYPDQWYRFWHLWLGSKGMDWLSFLPIC